jgi:uncharacterized protein YjbI with pentapeptide repeats
LSAPATAPLIVFAQQVVRWAAMSAARSTANRPAVDMSAIVRTLALSAFGALCLLCASWAAAAAAPLGSERKQYTPTEEWVVQQLANREPAQVDKRQSEYPDAPDAGEISGEFLSDLLSDAIPDVPVNGTIVSIEGARVSGPVDVHRKTIAHEVSLSNCDFDAPVNLSRARVEERLDLSSSTFHFGLDLSSAELQGPVDLGLTEFGGELRLNRAIVHDALDLSVARFDSEHGSANFEQMRAEGPVSLQYAHFGAAPFRNALTFDSARLASLDMDNAEFPENGGDASFKSMVVTGSVSLNGVTFTRYVLFDNASVGSLSGVAAHFNGWPLSLSFAGFKSEGDVNLSEATFTGPVSFVGATIGTDLDVSAADFRTPE